MGASALLLELVTCFFVSLFLLHKYGDLRRQNVISTLATFVAWYFSFLLVFTLPIDIASTFYRQCIQNATPPTFAPNASTFSNMSNAHDLTTDAFQVPSSSHSKNVSSPDLIPSSFPDSLNLKLSLDEDPDPEKDTTTPGFEPVSSTPASAVCVEPWTYIADESLQALFRIIYWTSQLLTWIILPLMQSYAWAGEFSVAGKLKSALIYNAIYYGSYLLIFGVLLIYVASKIALTPSRLKVIAVTASNTWGLFLLVLLLGYGLVEIPRMVWNSCNRNLALAQTHFKIAKLSTDKSEADEEMEDCLEEVKRAAETISYNHPHRRFVEIILGKCPEAMREAIRPCTMDDFQDFEDETGPKALDAPSEKTLVRLHVRVIRAMQAYHRTQAQWEALIDRALALEDEVRNIASTHRTFSKSTVTAKGDSPASPGIFSRVIDSVIWTPTVEWYWRCLIRPNLLRCVAIAFAIVSGLVVWSEVTFFVRSPVLSLFAVFIQAAAQSNYGTVVFICGATVSYLCLCAYYTIFRIRIFNYYYIASDHLTDENSLLFIGALLCRLTPPLCLNFLGLIHLDTHVTWKDSILDPSYSAIMGHLDVIPFIADGFNIYFPILILALCLATHFHLGSRCLHFLGFQQFIGDDEMTQDYIDDGRNLLNREKRHRERLGAGGSGRRPYRFGAYLQTESSERETIDSRPGGNSFAARNRMPPRKDTLDPRESPEGDFLGGLHYVPGGLVTPESPVDPPSRGGYQSGLPRGGGARGNAGNASRPGIRGIFDDV